MLNAHCWRCSRRVFWTVGQRTACRQMLRNVDFALSDWMASRCQWRSSRKYKTEAPNTVLKSPSAKASCDGFGCLFRLHWHKVIAWTENQLRRVGHVGTLQFHVVHIGARAGKRPKKYVSIHHSGLKCLVDHTSHPLHVWIGSSWHTYMKGRYYECALWRVFFYIPH